MSCSSANVDEEYIGTDGSILPGVTVGNNVVIAAGAVVIKEVPDNCVADGFPAKFIKSISNDAE